MRSPIYVIGVGPGSPDYVCPAARRVVEGCDLLVGGERALALFPDLPAEKVRITADMDALAEKIRSEQGRKRIAVLVSGDPGLYSILDFLRQRFGPDDLEVVPGISSIQLAFAKLRMSWQDAQVISLHGRKPEALLPVVEAHPKVAVLLDARFPPPAVAKYLLERGVTGRRLTVFQDLSYPDERVVHGSVEEIAAMPGPWGNCLVVICGD